MGFQFIAVIWINYIFNELLTKRKLRTRINVIPEWALLMRDDNKISSWIAHDCCTASWNLGSEIFVSYLEKIPGHIENFSCCSVREEHENFYHSETCRKIANVCFQCEFRHNKICYKNTDIMGICRLKNE